MRIEVYSEKERPVSRKQNSILLRLDDSTVNRRHLALQWPADLTQEEFDAAVAEFRLSEFGTRESSQREGEK